MNENKYEKAELQKLASAIKIGIYKEMAADGLLTAEQLIRLTAETERYDE